MKSNIDTINTTIESINKTQEDVKEEMKDSKENTNKRIEGIVSEINTKIETHSNSIE